MLKCACKMHKNGNVYLDFLPKPTIRKKIEKIFKKGIDKTGGKW